MVASRRSARSDNACDGVSLAEAEKKLRAKRKQQREAKAREKAEAQRRKEAAAVAKEEAERKSREREEAVNWLGSVIKAPLLCRL